MASLDRERFDGHGVLNQAADTVRPVLGLFGGADQAIPAKQIEEFESALSEAGVDARDPRVSRCAALVLRQEAERVRAESEDAWRRILSFLAGLREPVA